MEGPFLLLPGDCHRVKLGGDATAMCETYTTPGDEPTPTGVRVTIQQCILAKHIADMLVACFEGGANYWIRYIQRKGDPPNGKRPAYNSDWIANGGTMSVYAEGDEREHVATLESFASGIVRAAVHTKRSVESFVDDHDASDADLAMQFALFGEIIYG